jgi:hypothetical protein
MTLKNTGSADATIDLILLNGRPSNTYSRNDAVTITFDGQEFPNNRPTIVPGNETTGYIILQKSTETQPTVWKSGMTLEILVQTVAGRQYPKSIILP